MSFAIAPAPAPSSGFAIASVDVSVTPADAFPLYLQWLLNDVELGEPDVRVVDFVGPNLLATRGVGENSHVVTVRNLLAAGSVVPHYELAWEDPLTGLYAPGFVPPIGRYNDPALTEVFEPIGTARLLQVTAGVSTALVGTGHTVVYTVEALRSVGGAFVPDPADHMLDLTPTSPGGPPRVTMLNGFPAYLDLVTVTVTASVDGEACTNEITAFYVPDTPGPSPGHSPGGYTLANTVL